MVSPQILDKTESGHIIACGGKPAFMTDAVKSMGIS
jgi:hypothetical protein